MSEQKKHTTRSSALQREWQFYAPPKYDHLLHCFRSVNEMGKSETVNFIVRQFFDKMPKEEMERLLTQSRSNSNAV